MRPLHRCGQRCFLNRILRRRKVAESAHHSPEHLRRQLAQQVLNGNVRWRFGHGNSSGGLLMICLTSMGIVPSVPAAAGASEARAAIRYASSALFTSTIQYPARNSLASGKTPSVRGVPSLAARTITAWSGQARPSVATNAPESLSCWLNARMKAMFAWRSSFGHLEYHSKTSFVALIIRMYFM